MSFPPICVASVIVLARSRPDGKPKMIRQCCLRCLRCPVRMVIPPLEQEAALRRIHNERSHGAINYYRLLIW